MVMHASGINLKSLRMRAGDGKTGILGSSMAMVYECGPWTGCQHGLSCPQAVTQRVGSSVCLTNLIRPDIKCLRLSKHQCAAASLECC